MGPICILWISNLSRFLAYQTENWHNLICPKMSFFSPSTTPFFTQSHSGRWVAKGVPNWHLQLLIHYLLGVFFRSMLWIDIFFTPLYKQFLSHSVLMYNGSHFYFVDLQFKVHIHILRRPQNFVKSPPIIYPMYCQSNNWWRFRKILWPSQNIWTLLS